LQCDTKWQTWADSISKTAMVELAGVVLVLVLVYVMREPNQVRSISLRRASKQERTLYAQNTH
jgi:uncharacterized DUF497 family protein